MFSEAQLHAATALLAQLREAKVRLATAESCTGGLIAGVLTEIAGSSDVVERGFVVYSNDAKAELLGVPAELIKAHGAVSESVARAMAEGALRRSKADIAIAVTGVAGPGGGTTAKPVGLVHIAAARHSHATRHQAHNFGDRGRSTVRSKTIDEALRLVAEIASTK